MIHLYKVILTLMAPYLTEVDGVKFGMHRQGPLMDHEETGGAWRCFLLFYLRGDMVGTSGKGWGSKGDYQDSQDSPTSFLWYKHVYGITFTSISAWVRFVLRDSLVYLEKARIFRNWIGTW